MAQILANMSEYIQPHSLLNLNIEIEQLQENFVINKDMFEEMHVEEAEEETPQKMAEQTRVTSPKEPSLENVITESIEASLGEGTTTKEQTLAEQPSIEKGTDVPSKKKKNTNELEKLWRERQKLQKLVKQLRQRIRVLKKGESL